MGLRGPKPGTLRHRPRDAAGRLIRCAEETGQNGHTPVSSLLKSWDIDEMAQALRDSFGLRTVAANKLGCSLQTINNYIKQFEVVAEALAETQDKVLDIAERSLFKAVAEGNPWAVCFLLKTRGKSRGYVERSEHDITGPGGGPLQIKVVYEEASRIIDAS